MTISLLFFSSLSSGGKYSKIVYHRIWKNANNAIRKVLHKFAITNRYNEKEISVCKYKNKADCFNQKASKYKSLYSSIFFPLTEKSFSFTFVRNPVSRFISGYIEIEKSIKKQMILDLKYSFGTIERFIEFINLILTANGSMKLFREKYIDISMIAPMIGTLIIGIKTQRLGTNPFRAYKLENFDEDWKMMVSDSGYSKLYDLGLEMDKAYHEEHTQSAYKNISFSIAQFFEPVLRCNNTEDLNLLEKRLTHISRKGNLTGFHLSRKKANKVEFAFFYLRALCRIFVTDFICSGYELPFACNDIKEEVDDIIREHASINRNRLYWYDYFLPVSGKSLIANFYCIYSYSPDCYANFMQNIDPNAESLDDEL